jgi:hypothetical protein
VALPFSFSLYDQSFNGVNVSSNGRLDFVCINEPAGFAAACLPPPPNVCPFDYTIFGPWSDFHTGVVGEGCSKLRQWLRRLYFCLRQRAQSHL